MVDGPMSTDGHYAALETACSRARCRLKWMSKSEMAAGVTPESRLA